MPQRKSRGIKRVKKLCRIDMGNVMVNCICTHVDGLLAWKTIEDDLIELMNSKVPGGEDRVLEEEAVRLITLMDIRINDINKMLDVILGEMHAVRQLDSLFRSEI
jgi:hypothetical protein